MALEERQNRALLADLLARVRSIETGGGKPRGGGDEQDALRMVASGWGRVGSPREHTNRPPPPRGLERGLLHEFCGPGDGADFAPPLALLVHLARAALIQRAVGGSSEGSTGPVNNGHVAFVGRLVWPYPAALTGDARLVESDAGLEWIESDACLVNEAGFDQRCFDRRCLDRRCLDRAWMVERTLYVDTRHGVLASARARSEPRSFERGRAQRGQSMPSALLWAADRALRCPALAAVVIDGSGLTLAATRRLQLAAEAGDVLALVARPASDATRPSAAATRWIVERADPPGPHPAWNLVPLRRRSNVDQPQRSAVDLPQRSTVDLPPRLAVDLPQRSTVDLPPRLAVSSVPQLERGA